MKLIALLAALLLPFLVAASCDEAGTGGYSSIPPQQYAVIAAGTSTAAAAQVTATQSAYAATQAALDAGMTATAVQVRATNEAEAEATATVRTELHSLAAASTATAVAIITERENLASTATAEIIWRDSRADAEKRADEQKWRAGTIIAGVRVTWRGVWAAFGFFVAAMAALLFGWTAYRVILKLTDHGIYWGDDGQPVATSGGVKPLVNTRARGDAVRMTQPKPEVKKVTAVWRAGENGRGEYPIGSFEHTPEALAFYTAVSNGAAFNRNTAQKCGVLSSEEADKLIKLAVDAQVAYKTSDAQNAQVLIYPEQFERFINQLFPEQSED